MRRGAGNQAARVSPDRRTRFALGALAASLLALTSLGADRAAAQGATNGVGANLNISPKRVTFDRADRSATIYVFNQGNAPGTFDVTLVDRVMLPDGQIIPLSDAEGKPEDKPYVDRLKSAQSMLVVTPRRVTLQPGKGQTIRIRASTGAAGAAGAAAGAPAAGEYRTHLTVATIPPRDAGLTAEQAADPTNQELRFQINSVFGLSIPVVLRVGPPDVRGVIESAKYAMMTVSADGVAPPKPTPVVTFDLVRQGPNSLFGNLEVRSLKDRPNATPLAAARGLGVYPEIDRRQVQMFLSRPPAPGDQLEVSFRADDTSPGRLVAKTTLTVQ